jgi:hypothetical protein
MKALFVHASGKGAPKKERAIQQSSFRELLASIKQRLNSYFLRVVRIAPSLALLQPVWQTLRFHKLLSWLLHSNYLPQLATFLCEGKPDVAKAILFPQ